MDIVVYPREGPVEKLPENQIMNTTSNAETIIKNKDHPGNYNILNINSIY